MRGWLAEPLPGRPGFISAHKPQAAAKTVCVGAFLLRVRNDPVEPGDLPPTSATGSMALDAAGLAA